MESRDVEAGTGRFEFPEDGEHWSTIWTGGVCASSGKYTSAAAFFPDRINPVAHLNLFTVVLGTLTRPQIRDEIPPDVRKTSEDPSTLNSHGIGLQALTFSVRQLKGVASPGNVARAFFLGRAGAEGGRDDADRLRDRREREGDEEDGARHCRSEVDACASEIWPPRRVPGGAWCSV